MKDSMKARALWDYGGSLAALLGGCPSPGLPAPPRPEGDAGTRNQDRDTCPDPLTHWPLQGAENPDPVHRTNAQVTFRYERSRGER